jgi:hypothetical protein
MSEKGFGSKIVGLFVEQEDGETAADANAEELPKTPAEELAELANASRPSSGRGPLPGDPGYRVARPDAPGPAGGSSPPGPALLDRPPKSISTPSSVAQVSTRASWTA